MVLKWLFTLLAILWLYEAIVRISRDRQNHSSSRQRQHRNGGEYTDYDEIRRDKDDRS